MLVNLKSAFVEIVLLYKLCLFLLLYSKVAAMQIYRETDVDTSRQKFIGRWWEIWWWWWELSWRHHPHWQLTLLLHFYLSVYLAAWNSIGLTFLPHNLLILEVKNHPAQPQPHLKIEVIFAPHTNLSKNLHSLNFWWNVSLVPNNVCLATTFLLIENKNDKKEKW